MYLFLVIRLMYRKFGICCNIPFAMYNTDSFIKCRDLQVMKLKGILCVENVIMIY